MLFDTIKPPGRNDKFTRKMEEIRAEVATKITAAVKEHLFNNKSETMDRYHTLDPQDWDKARLVAEKQIRRNIPKINLESLKNGIKHLKS